MGWSGSDFAGSGSVSQLLSSKKPLVQLHIVVHFKFIAWRIQCSRSSTCQVNWQTGPLTLVTLARTEVCTVPLTHLSKEHQTKPGNKNENLPP